MSMNWHRRFCCTHTMPGNRQLSGACAGKRPNLHPKLQPGIPGYDFALELQPEIDGYNSVRQSCSYDFVATTLTKVVAVNLWL